MHEKQLFEKLCQKPLTREQIYQEYPFMDIKAIDRIINNVRKNRAYSVTFSQGYYSVRSDRMQK